LVGVESVAPMAAPPAYPYGVPPPLPYLPSVMIRPETVAGVRTYTVNLILDIVFGVFALAISLSALLISAVDPFSALAIAAVLGAAVCGLLIVFVINFIVSLMSVFKMHHGADEYGPEHGRNARLGVMYKWIGTGLSTTAAVLVVYLVVIGVASFLVPGQVSATVYVPLLVTVIWTAGVSSKGQMYRHMVRALQPPETRRRSDIASFIIPGLGAVALGVVGYATARVVGVIQNPAGLNPVEAVQLSQLLIGGVFLPPGLAVAGYVIFLTVFLQTSQRLSRGLAQMHATMPPVAPWAAYPTWPPANPYYPPPAAPPPAPPTAAPIPSGPPPPSPASPPGGSVPCPRCEFPNAWTVTFCVHCGNRLRI